MVRKLFVVSVSAERSELSLGELADLIAGALHPEGHGEPVKVAESFEWTSERPSNDAVILETKKSRGKTQYKVRVNLVHTPSLQADLKRVVTASAWREQLHSAAQSGEIYAVNPVTLAPEELWNPEHRVMRCVATLESIARFLEKRGGALEIAQPPELRGNTFKPKMQEQEDRILQWLKDHDHDPLSLPPNPSGKPGVKAQARMALSKERDKFISVGAFDDAWKRLRKDGRIREESDS